MLELGILLAIASAYGLLRGKKESNATMPAVSREAVVSSEDGARDLRPVLGPNPFNVFPLAIPRKPDRGPRDADAFGDYENSNEAYDWQSQPKVEDDGWLEQESRDIGVFDEWDSGDVWSNGINPATGLPMMGTVDAGGNPYGVNLSIDDSSFCATDSFLFDHSCSAFRDD
jgi:hypothetical protein